MKSSSIREWKVGDKGITNNNEIVTVKRVGERFIEIEEDLEKKLYIPAHGEIENYRVYLIRQGEAQQAKLAFYND
jgi:hypothetical protein